MYLDQSVRMKFAGRIIEAVGTLDMNKNEIDTFKVKFSNLEGLKVQASQDWMDQVVGWVREHPSEMARKIKDNYNNPQAVLDYIFEYKKPYF